MNYTVQIEVVETFYIDVDAEDLKEAKEKARKLLQDDKDNGAQWSNDIETSVVDAYLDD